MGGLCERTVPQGWETHADSGDSPWHEVCVFIRTRYLALMQNSLRARGARNMSVARANEFLARTRGKEHECCESLATNELLKSP